MDRRAQLIHLPDLSATEKWAHHLAAVAHAGDCIALSGDLGVGKTTFARAFIHALLPQKLEVISPTFSLVQVYETPLFPIWHFDFYRLESADELLELGLDEALEQGLSVIEWPEIARDYLPTETLWIHMISKDDSRQLQLTAPPTWQSRLRSVAA